MPGKLNTYTLGEFGINRVKSPIHLVDGELLNATNADVPFEKGNRGLRKRSGMAKLNADAAAGAIQSMSWIPLADPFGNIYLYRGFASLWLVSETGSAFSSESTPSVVVSIGAQSNPPFATYRGRLYFIVGNPQIITSFGADLVLASHEELAGGLMLGPTLFVDPSSDLLFGIDSTTGASGFTPTFFRYNLVTGAYDEFSGGGVPILRSIGALGGVAYLGGAGVIKSHDGTGFAAEFSPTAGCTVNSFVVGPADGKLYAAMSNTSGGVAMVIIRRDSAGSWTTVHSAANNTSFDDLCVTPSGVFYVAETTARHVFRSTDGTTWTLDEDLSGTFASLRGLMTWNDVVIAHAAPSDVRYATRDPATGTWTSVADAIEGGGHL